MAPAAESEKTTPAKVEKRPPFDPYDTMRVKHRKVGVWDLFEEIRPPRALWSVKWLGWDQFEDIKQGLETYIQFGKELMQIPGLSLPLLINVGLTIAQNCMGAWGLWYSSRLLVLTQKALEERLIDETELRSIIVGTLIRLAVTACCRSASIRISYTIEAKLNGFAETKIMQARLRLDFPTSEDASVQRQFEGHMNAWRTISLVFRGFGTLVQLVSQVVVLFGVVGRQPVMMVYTALDCLPLLRSSRVPLRDGTTWAATTSDKFYKCMLGIDKISNRSVHRKEVIAGNLQAFLASKWKAARDALGGIEADFYESCDRERRRTFRWSTFILSWSKDMSQIILLVQVIRKPASLPASYVMISLSRQVSIRLSYNLRFLKNSAKSLGERLASIRRFALLPCIPNLLVDGSVPFPEDQQDLRNGISVEFREVSFRYPGSESFALEKVSFRAEKGQLCVIVGMNGSGKSTLLKLLLRLCDPQEGQILINEIDIKTLRIADVRNAVSALFQDFTIFPFSIKDNIGMGDPAHVDNMDRISLASQLGGSTSIIDKLPRKYNSYLQNPVLNYYSNLPEGNLSLFGHKLSGRGEWSPDSHDLSGGEKQRLALSRSFMRYLDEDNGVAMLLFDEPSASLDPEAEYSLFERLRQLRASKTMIFSSHRFGNLTRHADLIIFMKESRVLEHGTHTQLLALGGNYASMYKMQASAFRDLDVDTRVEKDGI